MSFSNTQQGLQDPEAMSSVTQLIDTYVRTTSSTASPPGNLSPDVLSLDVGPVQVGKAMEHSLLLGLDDEGSSSGDGPSYIASRVHQRLESMCAPRSRAANGSGVATLRRRATGPKYARGGGEPQPPARLSQPIELGVSGYRDEWNYGYGYRELSSDRIFLCDLIGSNPQITGFTRLEILDPTAAEIPRVFLASLIIITVWVPYWRTLFPVVMGILWGNFWDPYHIEVVSQWLVSTCTWTQWDNVSGSLILENLIITSSLLANNRLFIRG